MTTTAKTKTQTQKVAKFYVFTDSAGVELARKPIGRGRPPQGTKDSDGNTLVPGSFNSKPAQVSNYNKVKVGKETIWYPKKAASLFVSHRFSFDVATDTLTDEGAVKAGRPKAGYVKIDDDRVVKGITMKGHWIKEVKAEMQVEVKDATEATA